MAQDRNDTKTVDLEHNTTDRAIRAIREYQKGACTTAFMKASLTAVPASELALVAIATRIPVSQLTVLRR